jgi:hypothetical protein
MPMAYLPVFCEPCARASLAALEAGSHELRCSFCEEPGRVIPGPIYADGDWLTFADIDKSLFEAELNGLQATALVEVLRQMLDSADPPELIAKRMIERVPSLAHARGALLDRLPRGLNMLMTLLVGRTREDALSGRPSIGRSPALESQSPSGE